MTKRLLAVLLLCSNLFGANGYVQKCIATGNGTTRACTLTNAVTAGNFIAVGIVADLSSVTLNTVQDQAANSYTILGPCSNGVARAWLAYRENVPGTAANGTTITATFSATSNGNSIWVREFSGIATSSSLDVSKATTCTGTGTTINLPSTTPTVSGDLGYAVTYDASSVSSIGSPWAAADTNIQNGEADAYLLSGSTALTAVNWTNSASGAWASVIAFFKTATTSTVGPNCGFKGKVGWTGKAGCV